MKTYHCLLVVFLLASIVGKGQTHLGPSLTASTSKIAYQKGTLDSELIAEIVATKQAEIKSELMNRLVLENFECGSFATWNFVRKNLDLLLNEKDKRVITKEMLQNAAELALVLGVSEYYLRYLSDKKESLNDNEYSFLYQYIKWVNRDDVTKDFVEKKFSISAKKDSSQSDAKEAPTRVDTSKVIKSNNRTQFLEGIQLLEKLRKTSYQERKQSYDSDMGLYCDNISPNHIFIDFVYDILSSNKTLKNQGFFLENGVSKKIYEARNKYLIFNKNNAITKDFGKIRNEINDLVSLIFKHFETIQYLSNKKTVKLSEKIIEDQKIKSKVTIKDAQKSLSNLKLIKEKQIIDKTWEVEISNIITFISIQREDADLLYFTKEKVMPSLNKLSIASPENLSNHIDTLKMYIQTLTNASIDSLKSDLKTLLSNNKNTIDVSRFIKLVDQIKNLDNPTTYQVIAKFLASSPEIFGDERTKKIYQQIVGDFDKYLLIDADKKELTIEVEDMAVDLFKTYGENQTSRFGMYFGVGLNYGFGEAKDFGIADSDQNKSNSINYVSEKIGLRYKLIDWNRIYSYKSASGKSLLRRSNSNRGPIINSLHGFAYFSGLLYQIDVLNSEDESFNDPLGGIGIGLGFFNGLDFNVSYAGSLNKNWKENSFWNIGFDIKITEYLGALRNRNK